MAFTAISVGNTESTPNGVPASITKSKSPVLINWREIVPDLLSAAAVTISLCIITGSKSMSSVDG